MRDDDIWESYSLNQNKENSNDSWYIQQLAESYQHESLFPNLKYWLLIIGFVVGIIFFVYYYINFAYEKRTECSNGNLAACVEYNYIINHHRR